MLAALNIARRLYLGFGTILVLLVAAVTVAHFQARGAQATPKDVVGNDQRSMSLGAVMDRQMLLTGRFIRAYALEGSETARAIQREKIAKARATYDEAEKKLLALLGSDGAETLAILHVVTPKRSEAEAIHSRFMQLVDQGKREEGLRLVFGEGRKVIADWEDGLNYPFS